MENLDLTKAKDCTILLKSSMSDKEWDSNCDKILGANFGRYPYFWYDITQSVKLYDQVSSKKGYVFSK